MEVWTATVHSAGGREFFGVSVDTSKHALIKTVHATFDPEEVGERPPGEEATDEQLEQWVGDFEDFFMFEVRIDNHEIDARA